MDTGAQCVMICGTILMLRLSVTSWDITVKVRSIIHHDVMNIHKHTYVYTYIDINVSLIHTCTIHSRYYA